MKILSLTAQKPDSTGSGVFLTELVKGFAGLGCRQAVVCGTVPGEEIRLPEGVALYPVAYSTPELPFPVCGMSDEMPYESTRYRDLSESMSRQLIAAFRRVLTEVVASFRPDVIFCHHLYFLVALAREMFPDIPIWGQCHGSDLRQLGTNAWQGDWIKENVRKLSGIFALGADAYHFGNASDMEKILAAAPADCLCMGNIDPAGEFVHGTPENMTVAVRDLIARCGKYPNFVPSSGCDIPATASWDNICAFFDAVKE